MAAVKPPWLTDTDDLFGIEVNLLVLKTVQDDPLDHVMTVTAYCSATVVVVVTTAHCSILTKVTTACLAVKASALQTSTACCVVRAVGSPWLHCSNAV
jgi:hypothetical protein